MPRDGAGTYTLPVNAVDPAVATTTISSSAFNQTMNDFATEVTDSLDRSGKGAALANIPMGGFKFTGLGAPSAANDSARFTDIPTSFTLTGDVTSSASVTTVAKIQGVTVAGTTGGTNSVFSNAPTLTGVTLNGTTVIAGVTTGVNPAAGKIGEVITSTVSGLTLFDNSVQNMTSISLTAGNWLVMGGVVASGAGGAIFTQQSTGFSNASGAFSGVFGGSRVDDNGFGSANISWSTAAGTVPVNMTVTTTVYLLQYVRFSTGTALGGGSIYALRVS